MEGGSFAFERTIDAALNSASGQTVRALLDAGLWEYRARARALRTEELRDEPVPEIESRMTPLLDAVLAHEGEVVRPAETILGQFVPQLLLLSPKWFERSERRLLSGGAEDPLTHPSWRAYLLGARVYDRAFSTLRPWCVRAAVATNPRGDTQDEPPVQGGFRVESSVTTALAMHVIIAVVRGLAAVGDEDALVETTFARVPARERAHVYMKLYRDWSATQDVPPPEYAARLLQFWAWRLDALESAPPTSARDDEAEGLMWFLKTPHLLAAESVLLGRRTLKLRRRGPRITADLWRRLGTLAVADLAGTVELVELVVDHELAASYTHLPFDSVAPVLRVALSSGDPALKSRAERLTHRIGEETGRDEFGQLLGAARDDANDSVDA